MPLTIAAENIKNRGTNLAKDGQDFDGINCKTLLKNNF